MSEAVPDPPPVPDPTVVSTPPPPPPLVTLTCHNPDCASEGIAFTIGVNTDDAASAQCGTCGQQITDVTGTDPVLVKKLRRGKKPKR